VPRSDDAVELRFSEVHSVRRCQDEGVEERVRALVDAEWKARLGVDKSDLHSGRVHVVTADLGANDAMSFLLRETCIVVVPPAQVASAREVLTGLDVPAAFTADALRTLVGAHAQVDGPSWHSYADENSFRGTADAAASSVERGDAELLAFLENSDLDDWAESGFPQDPSTADPATTQFWILREYGRVVAAGNMTEWRHLPADVGVLTSTADRGRGLAGRLVGAMVSAALPDVGVVRYRALASNAASLAVARRLGFEPYGQNFRARKAPQ
jgi:RimJ/RimL family protein N-acetyltransferase